MRRRGRKRGNRKFTIPLAPVLGIAVSLASPIKMALAGQYDAAIEEAGARLLGIDGSGGFHWDWMARGVGPIVVGLLVHKFVGGAPFNLNRMLASANVPVIRI